jgi:hypothetical protein
MTEKMISRRCAVSLFGLAAALGFAVPTTVLTTSDAEAQAQPSAPATPAPAAPASASTAPATSGSATPSSATPGMERRHARDASVQERLEARRTTLEKRREAQRTARTRREARRGNSLYMNANEPRKQK